jgi:hypothetical protein
LPRLEDVPFLNPEWGESEEQLKEACAQFRAGQLDQTQPQDAMPGSNDQLSDYCAMLSANPEMEVEDSLKESCAQLGVNMDSRGAGMMGDYEQLKEYCTMLRENGEEIEAEDAMKEACAQLDQEPDDGSGMKVVKRETGEGSEFGGDGAPLLLPPVSSEICDSVDAMTRYVLLSIGSM